MGELSVFGCQSDCHGHSAYSVPCVLRALDTWFSL